MLVSIAEKCHAILHQDTPQEEAQGMRTSRVGGDMKSSLQFSTSEPFLKV